ncbi:MAG: bifunctional diaminohydroxyphosphoribosylaminopyrimidine deaminase/5-amino-6-(5-phosphoribosylamino)uracil reductase RibD [Chloroflexi bacterium]|nr:bifunctional diaminohydroxyphosphoribosylaminopyrimidine deaminase/5-amino-6-(5-phosphoribosylamino)uracil reductase RibD [Chloroflexota bacterium]
MSRALALAREVQGRTSPNPAVGAVFVKDGRIVGEGATEKPGERHAEIVALQAAGSEANGATLYVTLEPCCYQGRTAACTEAIIAAGVADVHFSHEDPDSHVSGRGKAQLAESGIPVVVGEGEDEARRINEGYLMHRTQGRPFVIAKFATSLDGKIAATSGDSRWVSGPETRAWSHELRTRIDAIAVGVSTVLIDDPQLTARLAPSAGSGQAPSAGSGQAQLAEHQPLRIVIDSKGRTPKDASVLGCGTPTLIATTRASPEAWRAEMTQAGARVEVLPDDGAGRVSLPALVKHLGESDVLTLLVEGGGVLHGSFFDEGLVDKVHAVVAPLIVGGDAPSAVVGRGAERMADALRLNDVSVERLGDDFLITGYTSARAIST